MVDLSMPGYITKLLQRFLHPIFKKPEHQPHCNVHLQYGTKVQLTDPEDKTTLLQPDNITKLQQIIGVALYYARSVDDTLMTTLNDWVSAQFKGTQATTQSTKTLMDYCHTHSDDTIRYCVNQMKSHIHSNESYILASKAIFRMGVHFFLSDKFNRTSRTKHNGAVLLVASIFKNMITSAAEAELGCLFINAKEVEVLRTLLEEMVHPQGPTPTQPDNSKASGIINKTVKQRISKATDMRFYRVMDKCQKKHFLIYLAPGKYNMGDYHTKFHSPLYHNKRCPLHVHTETSPQYVPCDTSTLQQGCVKQFPTVNRINMFRGERYNDQEHPNISHGKVVAMCVVILCAHPNIIHSINEMMCMSANRD